MEQFNPKPVAEDIETKVGNLSGLNTTEKTSLVGAVNELSEQIGSLDLTLQAKRVLATAKTIHEINVPNDTLHFLIFGATSYGLHGYGMVATTSSGAIDAETLKLEGITVTTSSGKISCNIGSTARPFYMLDFIIRGSGWCTLS